MPDSPAPQVHDVIMIDDTIYGDLSLYRVIWSEIPENDDGVGGLVWSIQPIEDASDSAG